MVAVMTFINTRRTLEIRTPTVRPELYRRKVASRYCIKY